MSIKPQRKGRRVAWGRRVTEVARLLRTHGAFIVEVVDRNGLKPIVTIRFEHPDGRLGAWSEFQLTELVVLEEAIALAREIGA